MDCTFVVSQGEVEVPSSLGGQREQEVMSVLWFISVHSTEGLNDLKVKGQTQKTCHLTESQTIRVHDVWRMKLNSVQESLLNADISFIFHV